MSSSVLYNNVFQAKIGNVQNQADSSSVYSAGVWSFKNSTALTSVTIDNSGNVGVGATSRNRGSWGRALTLESTTNEAFELVTNNVYMGYFAAGSASVALGSAAANPLIFETNGTERMRIDASGNLLVGKTVSSDTTESGFLVYNPTASGGGIVTTTTNSSSSGTFTYHLYNRNATFNGYRFYVGVDGGIRNFSANNSSLSDERVKTDIKPAGSYLQKICSIPVKTFRYKDQGDDMDLTLGVIAQEVEAIAPELVNATDGFGDLPEDGVPLKTVYQTDLQYALMKCIQELKEKNDALEARLAALESKP